MTEQYEDLFFGMLLPEGEDVFSIVSDLEPQSFLSTFDFSQSYIHTLKGAY